MVTTFNEYRARSPSVTVKSRWPSPIIAGFVIAAFCRSDAVRQHNKDWEQPVALGVMMAATALIRLQRSALARHESPELLRSAAD
jgi:hypothetical protein